MREVSHHQKSNELGRKSPFKIGPDLPLTRLGFISACLSLRTSRLSEGTRTAAMGVLGSLLLVSLSLLDGKIETATKDGNIPELACCTWQNQMPTPHRVTCAESRMFVVWYGVFLKLLDWK